MLSSHFLPLSKRQDDVASHSLDLFIVLRYPEDMVPTAFRPCYRTLNPSD